MRTKKICERSLEAKIKILLRMMLQYHQYHIFYDPHFVSFQRNMLVSFNILINKTCLGVITFKNNQLCKLNCTGTNEILVEITLNRPIDLSIGTASYFCRMYILFFFKLSSRWDEFNFLGIEFHSVMQHLDPDSLPFCCLIDSGVLPVVSSRFYAI